MRRRDSVSLSLNLDNDGVSYDLPPVLVSFFYSQVDAKFNLGCISVDSSLENKHLFFFFFVCHVASLCPPLALVVLDPFMTALWRPELVNISRFFPIDVQTW